MFKEKTKQNNQKKGDKKPSLARVESRTFQGEVNA